MTSAPNTPTKRRRKRRTDYSQLPLIAYCRTSKDGGDTGTSIPAQEAQLTAWASSQAVEITVQHDAGHSGARMANRPGLQAALAEIEAGRAGGLVVAKLDRLGRNAAEVLALAEQAKAGGWRLAVLDVGLDSSSPVGELVMGVLASAAQFELSRASERNKAKADQLRREGRPRGREAVASEIADRIINMRAAGDTYRSIAATLEAEGVPTARGGIRWYPATVRSAEQTRMAEIEAQQAA
jgi:DNA invertase Pin-like site-specific DNA recombinase